MSGRDTCPDKVSNGLALRFLPLLHYLHEDLLELLDRYLCLAQLTLGLLLPSCRLLSTRATADRSC